MDHIVINELHCKNESNFKKKLCKFDGSHYEQLMSHTKKLAILWKMGHTEKWVKLQKWVTLKMCYTVKNWSHCEE